MKEIAIYKNKQGSFDVRVERDSVWLRQEQMAALFGRDRTVIGRHLRNALKERELSEKSNVHILHIAGSDKPVKLYDLDAIISVGYRVKSLEGVRFRQWATRVLKDHLVQGYTLHRQRFEQNAQELETALALVRKTIDSPDLTLQSGRGIVDIMSRYTQTFLLLQRYDDGLLTAPRGISGGLLPSLKEAKALLAALKKNLAERGEAVSLFAQERGDALAAILGNLSQSVFGSPAYPTIESKAAHLLYFVVKDHPFSDGNKRSAACLFIDFLNRNDALLKNGSPLVNDVGLAALTLLVAESKAEQKETMIHLIMNMLAPPQ
jgi:prophage maintenance system killer protein